MMHDILWFCHRASLRELTEADYRRLREAICAIHFYSFNEFGIGICMIIHFSEIPSHE